jgi:hypothetical protein
LVVASRATVTCDPLVPSVPDQPPEAAQEVAFVELHDSVEVLPLVSEVGLAVNWTVGVGAETVTVVLWAADPVALVQVSV